VLSTAGGAVGTVQLGSGSGAGIETLNIVSNTSANNLTSITSGATTVNISGSAALTIGTALAGATTISAADATGAVTVIADSAGTANDVAVTGGTGNDSADFSAGFEASDSFTGGDGTDTVILTQATASGTLGGTLTTVEQLSVSNAGTGTIDMDSFAGVTKVIYDAGITANGTATVDDIAATGLEIEVDVANAVAADATLVVTQKTDSTADDITITLDAIAAGEGLASLSVANAETVTLSADDDTTDGTGTMTIASLTATDATSISISGDSALTITNAVDPTTAILATLDAGSMTDALTLSGTNFASGGATVTLGSGNDVINVATMGGADTFILTNGGNDRLVYTALAQSDTDEDTVTGFTSGSDDIDLRTFTAQTVTTATQFGGVGADLATAQSLLGGANSVVAVFQADANRLWLDVDANGTLNSADFRVTLTDVATITAADLSLATTGNTITLNAATAVLNTTTSTNASAATTTAGDTITSSAAFITGSTIDGGEGADSLTINSGTTAVDIGTVAAAIANVETVITTSGVTTLTVAAADTGAATGSISTITGLAGTAQTLAIAASDDLTGVALRGFTTFSDGGANTGATYRFDSDNLTDLTAITITGGTADTVELADGTYDLSSIALTGTGSSTLDLDTSGTGAKTVTADAADLAMFSVITGEAAAVTTTLNVNDTDSLDGATVTAIDTVTIGTAANSNQALTLAGDDFTATNYTTVTGSGDDDLVLGAGAGIAAVDLTSTAISGVDLVNTNAATGAADSDVTLDAASITGTFTIIGHLQANIAFSGDSDYAGMTVTAGDYNAITLTTGSDVIVSELAFNGISTVASITGVSGGAAETFTVNMATAGSLDFDALAAITDATMTVNDTSGDDTIDLAIAGTDTDTVLAGTTINLANGGADTILVDNDAANADTTALTIQNFSAGSAATADKLTVTTTNATAFAGYVSVSAAATASADVDGNIFEIQAAVASVTDLTATGAGGAVEVAVATALGTSTANNSGGIDGEFLVLVYGAGASAGDVGVYEAITAANNADITAANTAVELIAILDNGVVADSLVSSNFI
jgi:hypothetical protein